MERSVLCRYVARPALAGGRLRILDAQRLCFALKTPWSDGTRHLLLSPMELLEKLAALVPPPRVLAPRARARDRIVPAQPVAEPSAADGDASVASCGHRLRWATLLARVFSSDLSECAACGGRLRIIAALTDPASIRPYLEGVGLPVRPPPRAPPDLPFRPVAVAGRTAGCALNGPSGPGLIRIRAYRRPDRTASSVEGLANDPLRGLPDPGGALSALTESPRRCLIFPIIQCIPEGVSDGDHRVRGNNFVQQLPVLSPPRGQDVIESDVVVGVSLNKEVLTIEGTDQSAGTDRTAVPAATWGWTKAQK